MNNIKNIIHKNNMFKHLLLAGALCLIGGSCWTEGNEKSASSLTTSNTPTITLNNGITIPHVGFGLRVLSNEEARRYVKIAIDHVYRLFDTAQYY